MIFSDCTLLSAKLGKWREAQRAAGKGGGKGGRKGGGKGGGPPGGEEWRDTPRGATGFQMGDRGFVVVGIDTLNSYLAETKTSQNADGSIRHYHILISNDNPPMLYWSQETSSFDLSDDFYSLD